MSPFHFHDENSRSVSIMLLKDSVRQTPCAHSSSLENNRVSFYYPHYLGYFMHTNLRKDLSLLIHLGTKFSLNVGFYDDRKGLSADIGVVMTNGILSVSHLLTMSFGDEVGC